LAQLPEFAGKTFVAILPDSAERYLSGLLFEGISGAAAEGRAGDVL
jgi:cysteine synthase A